MLLRKKVTLSNEIYVNETRDCIEIFDYHQFQPGIWSSRYHQYGRWHGPYPSKFLFDSNTLKVTGAGSDDVGKYIIKGIFSNQTNRMGLTKTYKIGTGNPTQNLGHDVIIQMAWNAHKHQFEGKWYVKTSKYSGSDKFELKFQGHKVVK